MLKFYVVSAGRDMVTHAGRTTTCRCKFKAHHYKQNVEEKKDIPKTWILMGKQFEDFRRKKKHF